MQQIRPGWTNDELHTATLAREESAQVISEVRSGRQQHGLPLPWPITETDLEATYLAGLEQDDESEQEKEDGSRPASSAALPGSEGEGDRADGAADASRDGLERAGGRDGEAGSEGHPGDPASASPGKKKPRRRGPQFVCDGGCIAELLRDAIAREHEALRSEEARHRAFKSKVKFQKDCYEYGLNAVDAIVASGNLSEPANAMLAQVVSRTVRCLRGLDQGPSGPRAQDSEETP